jgi:formate-dependent nitrite reductase cytochrome c552 subunit
MRTLSPAAIAVVLVFAMLLAHGPQFVGADPPKIKKGSPEADATDALGANVACYVCHMTFVKEELARVHLAGKVACINCHGPCVKHANDENIGATRPDIIFKRSEVDAACIKCHKGHDVAAVKVIARFKERKLPLSQSAVCTDCHGMHRIARAAAKP